MYVKGNVQAFNEDALRGGGYRYTDSSMDLAKRFSNVRTSRAIALQTDFTGKTVLDVGCGDGAFTLELAALGAASVVGIDPAAEAIERARARTRSARVNCDIQFACVNVYDLSAAFGCFDVVVLRGVLHHLPDAALALKAVSTVGHEIIVLEPNGGNPVLKLIERWSPYHVQHEEQSFLPRTIDTWLKLAGKTPIKRQFINFVPLFCDPRLARVLKWLEPFVEATSVLRRIGCGQYIVTAV